MLLCQHFLVFRNDIETHNTLATNTYTYGAHGDVRVEFIETTSTLNIMFMANG